MQVSRSEAGRVLVGTGACLCGSCLYKWLVVVALEEPGAFPPTALENLEEPGAFPLSGLENPSGCAMMPASENEPSHPKFPPHCLLGWKAGTAQPAMEACPSGGEDMGRQGCALASPLQGSFCARASKVASPSYFPSLPSLKRCLRSC